jgi:hypothetical protein
MIVKPILLAALTAGLSYVGVVVLIVFLLHYDKAISTDYAKRVSQSNTTEFLWYTTIIISYLFFLYRSGMLVVNEIRELRLESEKRFRWECAKYQFYRSNCKVPHRVIQLVSVVRCHDLDFEFRVHYLADDPFLEVSYGRESYWIAHW